MEQIRNKLISGLTVLAVLLAFYPKQALAERTVQKQSPVTSTENVLDQDQAKKNTELTQMIEADSVTAAALPAYQIEVSRTSATRDEMVWFTVTFNTEQAFDSGNLYLKDPDSPDANLLIHLDRISGSKFEGSLYVSNFTESASYMLDSVTMYDGSEASEDSAQRSDFLTISGTAGNNYPLINVAFDQSLYRTFQTAKISITGTTGLEDYRQCLLYLSQGTAELIQQPDGSFQGELLVDESFAPGKVTIDHLTFENSYGGISFYNSAEESSPGTINQDLSSATFKVVQGEADTIPPVFGSISTSTRDIARNGEVLIIVSASDDDSGVGGITAVLSDDSEAVLQPAGESSWSGIFKPNPFAPVYSPLVIKDVSLQDKAGNVDYATSYNAFSAISIAVGGFPYVGEISGSNRFNTAVELSGYFEPSSTVILAKSDDFPDALAAGPLSQVLQAPILLTQTDILSPETLAEIQKRGASKVIVMGGPVAISDNVITELQENGIRTIQRIAGSNRYDTAIKVADELEAKRTLGSNHTAILACGQDFPDALSVGSYAAEQQIPILLNTRDTLQTEVKTYLQNNQITKLFIIGGPVALSDSIQNEITDMGITVERISGANRFDTSVAVAKRFFGNDDRAFVCNGMTFADALPAAPLAGSFPAPLLLVQATTAPLEVSTYLQDTTASSIQFVTVIGGEVAVSSTVKSTLNSILSPRYQVQNEKNARMPLDIPTYEGSGQTTHPSVMLFQDGFAGYKYWMAHSPYPYNNDDYENPSIVASADGLTWETPAGLSNPLDEPTAEQLAGKYHMSDPELVFANGKLECWYRLNVNGGLEQLLRKTSSDGVNWSEREVVLDRGDNDYWFLSPSVIYENGKYKCWFVGVHDEIYYIESKTGTNGTWTAPVVVERNYTTSPVTIPMRPWHMDVMKDFDDKYKFVFTSQRDEDFKRNIYLGESTDGLSIDNIHIILSPSTDGWDNKEVYRPTILAVKPRQYRMYYGGVSTDNVWKIGVVEGESLELLKNIGS